MQYLLSIIIPTKNRNQYCLKAIETIVQLNDERIEIVVQDNSVNSNLKEKISILQSNQIKYYYHGNNVSFVDNFNDALEHASGEYLCIIGDDDAILPNIMNVIELMKRLNCDAVIPSLNCTYCWPSSKPFVKNAQNGYLCLSYLKNVKYRVDPINGLIKLLKNGGQNYQLYDLPRLYHGIIHRSALNRIKKFTSKYFDGLSPDIYITILLCFSCKRVYRLGYPVTISGMCEKSGSSSSATGRHTGELKDAPHFIGHKNYSWDKKVPRIYSVESIWAETLLKALINCNQKQFYEKFNVKMLDSICFWKYPQFRSIILKHAGQFGISKNDLLRNIPQIILCPFLTRLKNRIVNSKGSVKKYWNITEISNAVVLTMDVLNEIF